MKIFYKTILIFFCNILIIMFSSCHIITSKSSNTNSLYNDTKYLKVHFIDVGQGDSILIQVNGKNMLIDSGPEDNARAIVTYLQKLKIKELDYIVASHPHEDHIGAMSKIIKKFKVDNFYAPKKDSNLDAFNQMVNELKRKKLKIQIARKDISIDLGSDVQCSFLSPDEPYYEDINNYSVVTLLTYKHTKFIFMGDAENIVESKLIRSEDDISANVIKLGHHGSNSSSSSSFLDKVSPDIAVISCGRQNIYGHPSNETLEKLNRKSIIVYRTDENGSILLTSDGEKIRKSQK